LILTICNYFFKLSQGATSHPYLLQPPATYQPYFTPVNATSSINGGYPALLPAGLDQSSASAAAAAMLQMAVNSQANDEQRGASAKYYEVGTNEEGTNIRELQSACTNGDELEIKSCLFFMHVESGQRRKTLINSIWLNSG